MLLGKQTAILGLFAGTAIFWSYALMAQSGDSTPTEASSAVEHSSIITGRPFSAVSFVKTVKVLPNGKEDFIRYDNFPFQIARDTQGRIRIQQINDNICADPPLTLIFPPCPMWVVLVFDPISRTMNDWNEGEKPGHAAVSTSLSDVQVETAEASTSVIPEDPYQPDNDASSVTTQNLGEMTIEGISATGTRTTVVYPPWHAGNQAPMTIIHEVWASKDMRLVVRVVDGNPQGEETIAGLEHVSFAPDAGSFDIPAGLTIFRWHDRKHMSNEEWAIKYLENWFVK